MPPRKNIEMSSNIENSDDSDDIPSTTSLERVPHYNSKAAKPKQPRQRTEAQIKAFEKCRASRAKNVVTRMIQPDINESPPPAPPKLTRQVAEVIETAKPVRKPKIIEEVHEVSDDEPETIIRRIIHKKKTKPRVIEEVYEEDDEPAPSKPQIIQRQPAPAAAPAKPQFKHNIFH